MTVHQILPWIYAAILAIIHHFGEHLKATRLGHRKRLTSFSTGVTITYVFLHLLPEHHRGFDYLGAFGSLTVLAGFAAVHLAKTFVYQHEKSFDEIRHDFRELHSIFLLSYYFAIGLIIQQLLQRSVLVGTLFFIPVMFHTAISSFSLIELDEELLQNTVVRNLVTAAVFIGAATGFLLPISASVFYIILGLITGTFLYIVVHHANPERRDAAPWYFVLGLLVYSLLMMYVWLRV